MMKLTLINFIEMVTDKRLPFDREAAIFKEREGERPEMLFIGTLIECQQRLIEESDLRLTDVKCLVTGVCQETEGFKGTPHEGVDVCEDGCVWYKPIKK